MDLKMKKASLVAEAKAIMDGAKAAGLELTSEQITAIEAKSTEIADLNGRIERAEKAASFEAQFSAVPSDAVEVPEVKSAKTAKTLGDHFVKSAPEFKNARHNNHVAFEAPDFDAKAAGDVTVTDGRQTVINDTNVIGLDRRIATIANLLTPGTLSGTTLAYTVITAVEGAPGITAEGGQKPKVHYKPVQVREGLSKVAGLTDVSDEMIEDEQYVVSQINNELVADLVLAEEDQLLDGDGVYPNVKGIMRRTGVQTEAAADKTDNSDAIYRAKTKVHLATGKRATAVMINPLDYERERLRKDVNGQYIGGGVFTGAYGTMYVDEPNLWGLATLQTPAMAEGKALVGDFTSATLLRKGGIRIDRSAENRDNFEKNVVTLRAEERIGLKVPKPHAFVVVTLSSAAPAA